jgi:hypothetical protein
LEREAGGGVSRNNCRSRHVTRKIGGFKSIVFLTGSGSVRLTKAGKEKYNAKNDSTWYPYLEAWNRLPEFEAQFTPLLTNWLDNLQARQLLIGNMYVKFKIILDSCILNLSKGKLLDGKRLEYLVDFFKIRRHISKEFKLCDEQKYIELRIETFRILLNMLEHASQYGYAFVTTNWDKAFIQFVHDELPGYPLNEIPYFQIHGSFDKIDELYLPLDETGEDLRRRIILNSIMSGSNVDDREVFLQCNEILKALRSEETINGMLSERGRLIRLLEKAEALVIWGLGFSPEDFELQAIVSVVARDYINAKKWPKTIIIDPSLHTRNRIATLLSLPPAYRFDLDPFQPDFLEIFDERNL